MCLCRAIATSTVRVTAFWKKGVLPRDMGKEAMALECTNSLGSGKHVHHVPSLAASRSPVPPAALLWADTTWAGLPRGGKQRPGGSGVPC